MSVANWIKIVIFPHSQVNYFILIFIRWKGLVLLRERTFG